MLLHMLFHQLVTLCSIITVALARPPSKIYGGHFTDDSNYPFFVQIWRHNSITPLCGGTIVSLRYILTAAHCLRNKTAPDVSITVGRLSQYEQTYDISNFVKYDEGDNLDNDIALLKTTEDIVYHVGYVEAVKLTSRDYRDHEYPAEVVGYGLLPSDVIPLKLVKLNTKIYDHEKCKRADRFVTDDRSICTFTKRGQGFCNGDSGGPLLADGVQIGIVSYSDSCAGPKPDIYTRVYHYLNWIKRHIGT